MNTPSNNIYNNLNKKIAELKELESDFDNKLKELDNLLSELEYFFDEKIFEKYNQVISKMDSIYSEFSTQGEKISDEIKDLEIKKLLSEEESEKFWEKNPYSDDFDHEMVKGSQCKCILEWGKLSGNSDWYFKKGKNLKKEHEEKENDKNNKEEAE